MTRHVCPRCQAPVIPIRTGLGADVLLDPEPVDDIYTLNICSPGIGNQMPAEVVRRLHKCEVKE